MNKLEVFEFEGNRVRTQVDANGNPLFCVKDVCNGLLIGNVTDASKSVRFFFNIIFQFSNNFINFVVKTR
jgi:prophage antirepressor-like protein